MTIQLRRTDPDQGALTPETILEIAKRATRKVFRVYFVSFPFAPEDFEDAVQSAACHIWQSHQRHGVSEQGYLCGVGKKAVYMWLKASQPPKQETSVDLIGLQVSNAVPELDVPPIAWGKLDSLVEQRILTRNELTCLIFQLRGFTVLGICQEMGVTERAVYLMRHRILSKLRKYVGEEPPPRHIPISDAEHWQIERWRAAEWTWDQIAARLNRHANTVNQAHARWCEQFTQGESAIAA